MIIVLLYKYIKKLNFHLLIKHFLKSFWIKKRYFLLFITVRGGRSCQKTNYIKTTTTTTKVFLREKSRAIKLHYVIGTTTTPNKKILQTINIFISFLLFISSCPFSFVWNDEIHAEAVKSNYFWKSV